MFWSSTGKTEPQRTKKEVKAQYFNLSAPEFPSNSAESQDSLLALLSMRCHHLFTLLLIEFLKMASEAEPGFSQAPL